MEGFRTCDLYFDPNVAHYVVEYRGNFKEQIAKVNYACGYIVNDTLAVLAVNSSSLNQVLKDVPSIIFVDFRSVFVLQDISPSSVDNINEVKINPYLNLTGKDVLVGIVDSGIDYLNEEFIREDGTSKIVNIWDQSIRNNENSPMYIGQVYSNEQINAAIKASKEKQDPYSIVPSKDDVGHGTMVAGIIGARGYNDKFEGVAKDSNFVIVKLLESSSFKKRLEDNNVPPVSVYNTSEILTALEYLKNTFIKLQKPMVIFLGAGTTEGSHDGSYLISRYLSSLATLRGVVLIAGTGNQGAAQGHASGYIKNVGSTETVELQITKEMKYFSFNIWIQRPNSASITIVSPIGSSSKLINSKINKSENIKFIFFNTTASIKYFTPEHFTGHEVINIVFRDIKPGIWKFQLTGEYIVNGRFDIWLAPQITLPEGTKFLQPDPFNTLTVPSTALSVVTIAYTGSDGSLVAYSGKGFNTNGLINPDVSTIGTNILTTKVGGGVTTMTGSSAATAVVAGCSALLLQWGIIYGNDTTMYSKKVRSYFLYGASRGAIFKYPNRDIGYGMMDLLGTFNVISSSFRGINNPSNQIWDFHTKNLFVRIPKTVMEEIK